MERTFVKLLLIISILALPSDILASERSEARPMRFYKGYVGANERIKRQMFDNFFPWSTYGLLSSLGGIFQMAPFGYGGLGWSPYNINYVQPRYYSGPMMTPFGPGYGTSTGFTSVSIGKK
ncbi:hypothetical protein AB6A40_000215 [Gnathostoma spinigerum]|uniref:Uncharacterized protein n=1 Tax=Gnathostoma spinigerum TaxID=75299 RepID=A0ABD6E2W7_9BILA